MPSVRPAVFALVVAILFSLVGPTAPVRPVSGATAGLAPILSVGESPFTRNPVTTLLVMIAVGDTGGLVVERRASNDPATIGGVLVHGQAVAERSEWSLAAGPDGPRTIYAQLKYESGTWSPVGSVTVVLKQNPSTSVYFDIDDSIVFHDSSTGVPEPDWHEWSSTPADRIDGRALGSGSEGMRGFAVLDADWAIWFDHEATIVPGVYETERMDPFACTTTCAVVVDGIRRCSGTGTFVIHEIAFTADDDLERVDADFRLDCDVYGVMSGSIRYGSDRPIVALDQSADRIFSTERIEVGSADVDQSITFSNIGNAPVAFGDAALAGEAPGDFSITGDDCSGVTLSIGEECAVRVRFEPTTFGSRFAILQIPDNTTRGSRRVRLVGYAVQPTRLEIAVDPPSVAPGPAEVLVTVYPATAGIPYVRRNGGGFGGTFTTTTLTNPSRLEVRWATSLTPGVHTFETYNLADNWHLPAEPQATTVTVPDTGQPWGEVQVGYAGTTATRDTIVSAVVPDTNLRIATVFFSNDGVNWSSRTYAPVQHPWTLSPGDGVKTVYVKWQEDDTGQLSPVQSDTIVLDSVAPAATAPRHAFVSGVALSSGRLPVRLTWTGSDATSGIARYEVSRQTDGGAWSAASSVTAAALSPALSYGHTYRFRVRAIDKAGNASGWQYGPTFRLSGYSEATGAARYGGTWSSVSSTAYWGGRAKAASIAGRNVRFTFTGRSVGWVTLKSPARGRAAIYVNGVYQATVDLYASSTQAQRIGWSKNWTTSATRTLEIRVLGTAGRPRIDVDGFWVGS